MERILLVETAPFVEYTTHLVEATDDNRFLVVESEGGAGPKFLEVEGRFQHADLENGNGRVYPKTLWKKVLSDPRIVESLNERSMLGELDHPADGKSSLKNISHIITGLRMDESTGEVIGRARILNNDWGRQLRSIFEAGGKVGISSRGSGSIRPQGGLQVVQEDFRLNTFDFVVQPSTPNAFPKPTNESFRKSKNESVSLPQHMERHQEDRMDSIKRLTTLQETVAELVSEPVKDLSRRARKRLISEAVQLEVEVNRLMQEDRSVSTVAESVIDDLQKFRKVAEAKGENPFAKKDGEDKEDKDDESKDKKDSKDDSDDDKDDKKKKDKEKEVKVDVKVESEDTPAQPSLEEQIATLTAQRDAAIRQARTTYRLSESSVAATALVMNALREKLKAILAKPAVEVPVAESTDDTEALKSELAQLREQNEKLSQRNQRLETIINKVQEKMIEAESAEESTDSAPENASVEESVKDAPAKPVNTDPLPKPGSVKQMLEEQATSAKSGGAALAARALGVMNKVRSSHVSRGEQILESKSSVR